MDISFDEITNNTLKELEATQKEFWNIDRQTGVLIHYFIKATQSKSVLEIGTSNGYSGLWITKALKETGGRLTTIEYYDKRQNHCHILLNHIFQKFLNMCLHLKKCTQ